MIEYELNRWEMKVFLIFVDKLVMRWFFLNVFYVSRVNNRRLGLWVYMMELRKYD